MKDLETLRKEIDSIDREVAALLSRRLDLVKEIGEVKKAQGLPVLNAAREAIVLEKVRAAATEPQKKDALEAIYRAVMEESKKLE